MWFLKVLAVVVLVWLFFGGGWLWLALLVGALFV